MTGPAFTQQSSSLYSSAQSVLLALCDDCDGREAVQAIEAVGARLAATVPLSSALTRLDAMVAVDAVLVEGGDADPDAGPLRDLLSRLDLRARSGEGPSVVSIAPQSIDAAAAAAGHGDVTLLCRPDPADRIAALAFALAARGRPLALHDSDRDSGAARLAQLSAEVGRIATALARLAESGPETHGAARPVFADAPGPDGPTLTPGSHVGAEGAAQVRAILRARRARDQFFRAEIFADPAWDMLLDLMAARLEHQRVSVSSLCIAAAVPPTTALRWIKALTDEGVMERRADPTDGRRIFIELGDKAARAMAGYLDWLRRNPAFP